MPETGPIALMPSNLRFDQVVVCEGAFYAGPIIEYFALKPGQKILIYGASGAIGTAALQLAKDSGAKVTAVVASRHIALVRSLGADFVIDYTTEAFEKIGRSFDFVLDAVGKLGIRRWRQWLKPEGVFAATDRGPWSQNLLFLLWSKVTGNGRVVIPLAKRAQAASLPLVERTKAITALGFIASPQSANALLDIAQTGGTDLRANPALWWLLNYKDSRWADAGVDAELKKRGLFDPDAVKVNEVTVPEAPPATLKVADIVKLRGDAKRGATAAAACQMCHRINGQGTDYAPDLSGFASRQTREVVATAIVDPSNDIAHGYDGTEVSLTDGRKVQGLLLSGGNPLIVQSTGGVTQMIPAAMVKERKRLGRSLMLSADQLGLSAQQVADVIAYLK
jgi:putative heme-binding domain-containing protein